MGVKGLSTFIAKNNLLEPWQLSKCKILIDGNNLEHHLFSQSQNSNEFYGGDFHNYAKEIEAFFECLHACSIEPLIILDGGMNPNGRKYDTLFDRRQSQFTRAMKIASGSARSGTMHSDLLEPVFLEVIKARNIKC